MRDDVDEADSPVCGRRIIDVKLVAERLGLGEKLHLGYNIVGKIEVNWSAHLLQVAIVQFVYVWPRIEENCSVLP